ncbi:DNA-directed RNA polymerase subunit L [Candidatus Woesearchaeota archaeon]|nr:DNA-directed RNA polymerase subunit L [Candidatus Woesearchaeota archaeon]
MKLNILENKKNKLVFESRGLGHTFCNVLKKEMWNDSHIKVATYSIRHPLVSKPKMIIETDGNETAKNALLAAVQRLKKVSEKFKKEFSKEVRI